MNMGRGARGEELLADATTHLWDIARATGQESGISDKLSETVLATGQGIVTDESRGFAGIHPAVVAGDDASGADRLAAFMGRQP